MAVFTRMYSLMMLEGIVLLYCHVVLWQALQQGARPPRAWAGLFAATLAGVLTQYFFLVYCFFLCGLFGLWLLVTRRFRTAAGYAAAELAGLGRRICPPTMKQQILSGSRGKQAFTSVFDVSALADWAASLGRVFRLLAAQFAGWRCGALCWRLRRSCCGGAVRGCGATACLPPGCCWLPAGMWC